jgi:uncharacterized membrane protein YebE (DUF533 family)
LSAYLDAVQVVLTAARAAGRIDEETAIQIEQILKEASSWM